MVLLKFGPIIDNLMTIGIIIAVFYMIYAAMKETKVKQSIRDGFKKLTNREDK